MKYSLVSVIAALLFSGAAQAQENSEEPAKEKWDVNAPKGATISQVAINVDEGSWIDVDVSPDGQSIVFALLGDIYTMPVAGGKSVRIAEGLAW